MIPVTKSFLPPMEEYQAILKRAWDKGWITNRGELVKELEQKLKELLGLNYITITNNGTIALQIAIKALEIKGEVITTPFSYIATTSSLVWENCIPVFVDIDPDHMSIDETKIEAAITKNTSAILATHVFGNPCHLSAIEAIARKHNLKVVYDAAHCFGVKYNDKSVFLYGDVSTCSFHATKIFHTAEGGAMFTNSKELHDKLFYHHNFGHKGPTEFQGLGINGKLSELNASLGLAILPYLKNIFIKRRICTETYNSLLESTGLRFLKIRENAEWNYSYYPVIFKDQSQLLKAISLFKAENIFPRRYFYPSLSSISYVKKYDTPIADKLSSSVLCLPLYHDLSERDINRVVKLLKQSL
ncbi:MAG TPA: DegT/DnrJ/EryC1/StrS family aminotransferase [Bacteroidia bacterium]|nr:DegT/DnrJ/EryC1/StrS family aminotransferase [Bacteroidia bacterium]